MKETEMVDVLIGASYEGKTPSPFVKKNGTVRGSSRRGTHHLLAASANLAKKILGRLGY